MAVPAGNSAAPMFFTFSVSSTCSPMLISFLARLMLSNAPSGRVRSEMSSQQEPLLKLVARAMTLTVRSPSSKSLPNALKGISTLDLPAGIVTELLKLTSVASLSSVTVRALVVSVLREMIRLHPVSSPSRMVGLLVFSVSVGPSSSVIVILSVTTDWRSPIEEQLQSVI